MDAVRGSAWLLGSSLALSMLVGGAMAAQAQTGSGMHQMQGQPGGHMPCAARGGPGDHGGPPSPDKMFAEMDTNHDGNVSRAEFQAF